MWVLSTMMIPFPVIIIPLFFIIKSLGLVNSLWGMILEAILWGFAALLTPCVFPMVPMTVSFFMKSSGSPAMGRFRAGMYGFFIVALYTLPIAAIIVITRIVGGDAVTADIFNWLATHWLPNLIFFIVFMVFAASFFGAFEITMPSWMVNKTDSKADSKGLAGIFFMALTLVLVSFSCTGPIVGSVLIKSTAGEFWSPIVTMLAFSVAFALPFTLFAFFPSMLKKLPKSGGWLNSVKVVLGFIEVALGMQRLIEECNLTQDALSEKVGKKRSTVSNYMRLLKLPDEVQLALKEGLISMGHAKAIAGAPDGMQVRVLKRIIKKGLSVRQAEELVRSLTEQPAAAAQNVEDEEYPESYSRLVEQLEKFFSQDISIKRSKNGGGRIVIGFGDDKDIEQFIERFSGRIK